jgi:hypothetical protein
VLFDQGLSLWGAPLLLPGHGQKTELGFFTESSEEDFQVESWGIKTNISIGKIKKQICIRLVTID